MSKRSILALCAVSATLATALAGCSRDVPMEAAENANDPACANVIVGLPDRVAGLERRYTNAQSTGAWGDPARIELRCGIEPSGPTTDRCVSVFDVDWVIDESAAPIYRLEAYGREPGLEVYVNSEEVSGFEVASDLSKIVSALPQTRECLSLSDTFE